MKVESAVADSLLSSADDEQVRMMEEQVILTDYYDRPIGAGSKKDTHIMTNIEDKGMLHRAFSVFLFSPEGKLILQQRSGAKITFPFIWANTCCSHPLSVASETIEPEARGVKNAARRKLEHELGIPPEDVPLDSFTWLTRVHYVGASMAGVAPGEKPFWGEHEIDWILMCKPSKMPRMALNENEVAQTRAFTQDELKAWMATRAERGDEVSPWFGLMEASGLLYRWWDAVLAGDFTEVLERDVIHRQQDMEAAARGLEPASVPMPKAFASCLAATKVAAPAHIKDGLMLPYNPYRPGGASASASSSSEAAYIPGASAAVPKQGAYGKVAIHTESVFSQLTHLDEVFTAIMFKLGRTSATKVRPLPPNASKALQFCEKVLVKVSRSFALVIQQLPDHLRTSVCIFYLVLRGLDTVEDDMTAFAGGREAEKLAHLRNFYRYLREPVFSMEGVGEGDEALLLKHFTYVNKVFASLAPVDQEVIADICRRMGEGMADYSGRDLREGTVDRADYGLYCHYVAGLVGEGLSRLFVAHGDEDAIVGQDLVLADEMGLFLQKTNIIRDYLEDLVDGRAFWPREIWSQYAPELKAFRLDGRGGVTPDPNTSLAVLNHMVADALTLAPSCLRYLERLRCPSVFRFCAIPQVMAIATLARIAGNADVFTGVVKIRKGQALKLIADICDAAPDSTTAADASRMMVPVYKAFLKHAREAVAAIPPHHKQAHAIATEALSKMEAAIYANWTGPSTGLAAAIVSPYAALGVVCLLLWLLSSLYGKSHKWGNGATSYVPRITDSWDVAALAGAVGCVAYLFALAGVPLVNAATAAPAAAAAVPAGKVVPPAAAEVAAASPTPRKRAHRSAE